MIAVIQGSDDGVLCLDRHGNSWIVFNNVANMLMPGRILKPFLEFLLASPEDAAVLARSFTETDAELAA